MDGVQVGYPVTIDFQSIALTVAFRPTFSFFDILTLAIRQGTKEQG